MVRSNPPFILRWNIILVYYLTTFAMSIQDFYTQQGDWIHIFAKPLPHAVSKHQVEQNNKQFTLDDVVEWVEKNGYIKGWVCV